MNKLKTEALSYLHAQSVETDQKRRMASRRRAEVLQGLSDKPDCSCISFSSFISSSRVEGCCGCRVLIFPSTAEPIIEAQQTPRTSCTNPLLLQHPPKTEDGEEEEENVSQTWNLNQQLGTDKNLEQGGTRREQKKNQPKGTKPAKKVDWAGGGEEKFLGFLVWG